MPEQRRPAGADPAYSTDPSRATARTWVMPRFAFCNVPPLPCPACGATEFGGDPVDILRVPWGLAVAQRPIPKFDYEIGEMIRWRSCLEGTIHPWTFFRDVSVNIGGPRSPSSSSSTNGGSPLPGVRDLSRRGRGAGHGWPHHRGPAVRRRRVRRRRDGGHIRRLAGRGGSPVGSKMLPAGRVSLTLGSPSDWEPGTPDRAARRDRGRGIVRPLMLDQHQMKDLIEGPSAEEMRQMFPHLPGVPTTEPGRRDSEI
jgi:hypothetical protein